MKWICDESIKYVYVDRKIISIKESTISNLGTHFNSHKNHIEKEEYKIKQVTVDEKGPWFIIFNNKKTACRS